MSHLASLRRSVLMALLAGVLTGCASAKAPPGWPPGEARPINAASGQKAGR
ncbi:hypothetical protein [Variovorax sp. E3]|uniref:hypothetical protein n=1 Tax=Variovorax sp. E3 TaxID=1914993 RepID=UPI0018DE3849|nr:hypothetical protein [Variovorax sp. E3]